MAESTPITVRIDNEARDRAQGILETLGLPLSTYLNMAVHQLANHGTVPFEIVPDPKAAAVAAASSRIKRAQAKVEWEAGTASWNPLAEPAALLKDALAEGDAGDRTRAYETIRGVAETIVPRCATSSADRFYEDGARNILLVTLAYLFAERESIGIADVAEALSDADALDEIVEWASGMSESRTEMRHYALNALKDSAYIAEFAKLAAEAVGRIG